MITIVYAMVWTEAAPFTTWVFNHAGVTALKKGDKAVAYKSFTRALDADPLNPRVQLNLGNAFEINEEFDKAASTYEGVLSLLPKDGGFSNTHDYLLRDLVGPTYFNLGNARAQAKNVAGAVQAYQSAFENGVDAKTVKTNIELLFKGGGGGDGQGQSKDPNDQKDQKDKDDQKKDDRTNQQKREDSLKQPDKDKDKGKPKPFQSQELTPDDVKRILDEIKNQEQSIRAQENDKQPKDAARGGKDW